MPVKITTNLEGLGEAVEYLELLDRGLDKLAVRAVNKTATGLRTDLARKVTEKLNTPQRAIKKATTVRKAHFTRHVATVEAEGENVPLFQYGARPKTPEARKPRKGASVKVRKDGPRKWLKNAFVARMRSGHVGLFERRGKGRLPIDELWGPSFVDYMDGRIMDRVLEKAMERLETNLDHELDWLLESGK